MRNRWDSDFSLDLWLGYDFSQFLTDFKIQWSNQLTKSWKHLFIFSLNFCQSNDKLFEWEVFESSGFCCVWASTNNYFNECLLRNLLIKRIQNNMKYSNKQNTKFRNSNTKIKFSNFYFYLRWSHCETQFVLIKTKS